MPLKEHGNTYILATTSSGIPTFKHVATNEILHGQVGPYEEATRLYVESSKIKELSGDVVVYDIGMGCGAQLIAMYRAFLVNLKLKKLTIVSFDLEKQGLVSLLRHSHLFSYISEFKELLHICIEQNDLKYTLSDGRVFEWIFIEGDFCSTIAMPLHEYPMAHIVCYDFFSPASHPHLWSYQVFKNLKIHMAEEARLITYSSATCVRAALLASDFFVGFGPISGKKAQSTLAATVLHLLNDPLPKEWKQRFERSGAKFCLAETELSKDFIIKKIESHCQWI